MSFEGSFPAVPLGVKQIRDEVGAFARGCGLDRQQVNAVMLAASEAATNAIVHAYRDETGSIRVRASMDDDELTVVVADDGGGHLPRIDSPGAGLGMPIIARIAQRVEIVSSAAGTELHMVFARRAEEVS